MPVELVVGPTVGSGIMGVPEPFAVPVGLREITAHPYIFLTEGIEHPSGHIALGIVFEGMFGDGEIGVLRVEHAETVVVLGREDHVLHTSILHHVRPLFGVEVHGVELVFQSPIPFLVRIIVVHVACNPVFGADRPRLYDSGNGVDAPVEEHAKLLILPVVELGQHCGVGRPHIVCRFRLLMYITLGLLLRHHAHYRQ